MGTSLWLGIAIRSIWTRPSPFYSAPTSSALESCRFLARLPSSPQVVSESHPAAICHRLGLPPEILGKKEHPLLSMVGASMEARFPLQLFTLKETADGLRPLEQQQPETLNYGHMGISGGVIWRFKEVAWSGHMFKPSKAKPLSQQVMWTDILQQKEHAMHSVKDLVYVYSLHFLKLQSTNK